MSDEAVSEVSASPAKKRVRVDARPVFARHASWFDGHRGNESESFTVSRRFESAFEASTELSLPHTDIRKTSRKNIEKAKGQRYTRVKDWFFSYNDFEDCTTCYDNLDKTPSIQVDAADGAEEWRHFDNACPNEQISSWGRVRRRTFPGSVWNKPYEVKATSRCRARFKSGSFQDVVFKTFCGNLPADHIVVRKNGVKDDFRASNLQALPRDAGYRKRTSGKRVKPSIYKKTIRVRHYAPNSKVPTIYESATACRDKLMSVYPFVSFRPETILKHIRAKTPCRKHHFSNAAAADPGPPPPTSDAEEEEEEGEGEEGTLAFVEESDDDDSFIDDSPSEGSSDHAKNLSSWESVPAEVANKVRETLEMN